MFTICLSSKLRYRPHQLLYWSHIQKILSQTSTNCNSLPGQNFHTNNNTILGYFMIQLLITLGYLGSPLLLSRMDCKHINMIFLTSIALSMAGIGASFQFPGLPGPWLAIPCLVVAGASYGLGVGPVSFVLMSSLFTQKNKSLGVAFAQTTRQAAVLIQVKVVSHLAKQQLITNLLF